MAVIGEIRARALLVDDLTETAGTAGAGGGFAEKKGAKKILAWFPMPFLTSWGSKIAKVGY